MTVTLVAGPGGSGSTTIAVALACGLAATVETVLITTAPALPDASTPSDTPAPAVVRPDVAAFVAHHVPDPDEAAVQPREIAALPGVDLLAVLAAVGEAQARRPSAALVVDAGSRAVELVGILERLARFTDALVPQPLRILGRVTGKSSAGGLAVWDSILEAALPGAVAVASATAVVVVPAEAHRTPQARLVPAQLSLFGIGTRALIDRSAGPDGTAAQSAVLTVPWPTGSTGAPDLSALLLQRTASPSVSEDTVVAVDDGYEWPLPVPGARREQLDLERDDDALLISVGAVVRRVDLPSVLQRCSVSTARFADGVLTVGFVPDPSRWPAWARQSAGAGAGDE